jgi:prepilin-type N-terminal cleavage/methylation domain-containing protein
MKQTKTNGFTLIELLVVVAIIGILATIVLASLGAARTRAKDAAVLTGLSSYRTQAELDYPTGNYTGLCSSGTFNEIELYIQSQGGDIEECDDSSTDYRVVASLPSSFASSLTQEAYAAGEDGFCVNSLGTAQKVVLEEVNELAAPACHRGEVILGELTPDYQRRCNDYTPEYTGCFDSNNGVYVNASLCDGLPGIPCR